MATQTYTDGVTLTAAAEFNKFDTAAYPVLTGVAGTNTVTATGPANYALTSAMPPIVLVPAVTSTGAVTLQVTPSGGAVLTAKNVFFRGGALYSGELVAGVPYIVEYDGTQFNLIGTGSHTVGTTNTTTGGTAVAFAGLPAGIKAFSFDFAISFSGTDDLLLQLSQSATFATTGYSSASIITVASAVNSASSTSTAGIIVGIASAAITVVGRYSGRLVNPSTNQWYVGVTGVFSSNNVVNGFGTVSLSGVLDGLRIKSSGSDTFDVMTANIQFER